MLQNAGVGASGHDDDVTYSAAAVASLALFFTVASFWWLHVRKGEIRGFEPTTFLLLMGSPPRMSLRLPLVVYNSGARDRVVRELRCVVSGAREPVILDWASFHRTIEGKADDHEDMAAPFAVRGRTAERHMVQFTGLMPDGALSAREYEVVIEGRLDAKSRWTGLTQFTWRAWHVTQAAAPVHSNSPNPCSDTERSDSVAFFTDPRPGPKRSTP